MKQLVLRKSIKYLYFRAYVSLVEILLVFSNISTKIFCRVTQRKKGPENG